MRHQTQHVSRGIAKPCNIVERAVRIGLFRDGTVRTAIPEHDLGIGLDRGQGHGIGMVVALGVGNGKAYHLSGFIMPCKRGIGIFHFHPNVFAYKGQADVRQHGAGQ